MTSNPASSTPLDHFGDLPADPRDSWVSPEEETTGSTLDRLMETSDFSAETGGSEKTVPPARRKRRPGQPHAFDLEELIAVGGFGEVWRGRQVSLGRPVALKRLRRDIIRRLQFDVASLRRYEEAFSNEAIIAASLEHPNIVPIHELGIDEEGYPLLAMKLVRGKPWSRLIREEFDLPVKDFLSRHLPVLASVAQAVAFAHSRGVIHRDIKPSQIMVGEFGEVQLMDWGLALRIEEVFRHRDPTSTRPPEGSASTAFLNTCGTIAFMAPEQATRDVTDISERTDVYLLGATLYYLLTGKPPRTAETSREALRLAIEGCVTPPGVLVKDREVPDHLADLAMRALAKDPAARPPSVEDFLLRLREAIMGRREDRRKTPALIAPPPDVTGPAGNAAPHEKVNRDSEETAPLRPLRMSASASSLLEGMFHRLYLDLSSMGRPDLLVEAALDIVDHFLSIPPQMNEPEGVARHRCEILCEAASVLHSQSRLDRAGDALVEVERQIRERLDRDSESVATREELANALSLSARVAHQQGKEEEAWRKAREVRAIRESLLIEVGRHRIDTQLAESLLMEGYLLWRRGDFDAAAGLLEDARRHAEFNLGESHNCHESQTILGRIWNNMAWISRLRGDLDAAMASMEKSFQLHRQVMEATHGIIVHRVTWLWSMRSLALLHEQCGNHDEAIRLFEASLSMTRHLAEGDPGNRQRRSEEAFSLAGLGRNHLALRDPARAEAHLREAASILLHIATSNPDQGRNIRDHIGCLVNLGEVLLEAGRPREALAIGISTLTDVRRSREELGVLPRKLIVVEARCLLLQGRALQALGSEEEARKAFSLGVEMLEPLTKGRFTPPETAETCAALLILTGRTAEAAPFMNWLRDIQWKGRDFLQLSSPG